MAINEKEARFESRKEKVEFVRSVYDQDQAPQHLHLHLSLKIIKPLTITRAVKPEQQDNTPA